MKAVCQWKNADKYVTTEKTNDEKKTISTKCELEIIGGAQDYIKERGERMWCLRWTVVLEIFKVMQ